jgi:hypothetical protein
VEASGLSAFAFAKRHGFAPQNLSRWAANLPSATTSTALSFVRPEAALRLAAPLVVEVGSARVRVEPGFDPAFLRAIVYVRVPASGRWHREGAHESLRAVKSKL